jgi:hypothetical protein
MGTRMRKIAVGCVAIVMFLLVLNYSSKVFCATQQHKQQQNQDAQMEDDIQGDEDEDTAPPGSLFKKISKGMSMQHVTNLIGPPNDTKEYITGKNFIPFYMGTDNVRLEAIYKGQGRITFTGRPLRVYLIVNNPNESGYNE